MRRPAVLIAFIVCVFVAGALLSPWVYALAHKTSFVANTPFPRVFSRTLLVLAMLGIMPLIGLLRLNSETLGLSDFRKRPFVRGVMLGLAGIAVVMALSVLADARTLRTQASIANLVLAILFAGGGALVTALMEELIFRGVVFGALRSWNAAVALVFSSALYAAVHFLHTPKFTETVTWSSGFNVLAAMFQPENPALVAAQFVNLFFCGAILCVAFMRTGALWFSIGLHAGWIFWLKLANALTRTPRDATLLWGSRKLIDGWAVTPLLALTLFAVLLMTRQSRDHAIADTTSAARLG